MFPFVTEAYAQTGGGSGPSTAMGLIPFVLIFVIMYFLILRPQIKKQKAHQTMLQELKKGDKIVTNGGVIGTIQKITDQVVSLQIADKVVIQVERHHIEGKANFENKPEA